jgi:hypothetical protein
MFVIITVTHGICVTKISRFCDLRAKSCATRLKNILQNKKIKHSLIKFPLSRLDVDANRKKPENQEAIKYWELFNKKIVNQIDLHKKNNILLFDIHSFPKGEFENAQIAIIDIQNIYRQELTTFADYMLNKYNINIKIFNGANENFIQETYKDKTYPLLIEFCEDKKYLLDETIDKFFYEILIGFKL